MSWKSIVSATIFEAPIVGGDLVEALVGDRHDGDVRLDRRERVVRRLGAGLVSALKSEDLPALGMPDDPDLHRTRARPTAVPEQRRPATMSVG